MARMLMFSCVLGIAVLTTPFAQAAPILSASNPGGFITGAPLSAGWEFQTGSSPVTVGALDALFSGNPAFTSTQVRLYDGSMTTLRSATVTTADPTETAGLTWHTHPIGPITLAPDTTYFIAQDTGFVQVLTSTPTLTDGVQYLGGVSAFAAGLNPTSDALASGAFNPAYFGPNFDPIGPAVIPEPTSLSILAAGLGIAGWWRKRRAARIA